MACQLNCDGTARYREGFGARSGEIANFTGISSPYEPPLRADLIVETDKMGIEECVSRIVDYVERHFRLQDRPAGESLR